MTADGLLLVDKTPGPTSHDAVQRARRILKERRIGHCGTLDPDATGLLLLPVGLTTRLTRFLIHAPKVYEGTVRFGIATDTYDASGRVLAEAPVDGLTEARIATAMVRFVGTFEQKLPAFSAQKLDGVKLYELARRGEEVPETARRSPSTSSRPRGRSRATGSPFGSPAPRGPTPARSPTISARSSAVAAIWRACADRDRSLRGRGRAPARRHRRPGRAWRRPGRRLDSHVPSAAAVRPELALDATQERRVEHGQTVLAKGLEAEEGDWVKLVDGRRDPGGRGHGVRTARRGAPDSSPAAGRVSFLTADVVGFRRI